MFINNNRFSDCVQRSFKDCEKCHYWTECLLPFITLEKELEERMKLYDRFLKKDI